jgi:TolB-like protein/DNA-binding winged helix-turn-helix (wHTH) protein/Tfp pilus assembly protein PilF
MDTAAPKKRLVRFGSFEADLEQRVLTKNGGRVRLQDQPFQVLTLLLERAGETISREEVRQRIWSSDTYVEFDDGLNTAIKKIRLALGDAADNPLYIETVPRRGYRFVAPISYVRTGEDLEQANAPGAALVNADFPNAAWPNQDDGYRLENPTASSVRGATVPQPPGRISAMAASRSLRPWLAGTLLLAALAGSYLSIAAWHERTNALRSIRSLAVLPMQNFSGDPTQEYFAEGISDELTTRLAQIPAIKVISRTSTAQYKGTTKSVPQIGQELGVDAVVEGSVERAGESVRVRVQLIQVATDRHLWAESYDRKLGDVLLLENDLAREIADQVQVHTTGEDHVSLGQVNPNALQDYLQGNHYWALRTDGGLPKAIEYFNRSIAEDPGFARSYAALANCYIVYPMFTGAISQVVAYPKATEASHKALALDPSLPESHLAAAEVALYVDWDFVKAKQEFDRTLELSPNYATAHQWYGEYLSLMGQHTDAIREDQMAAQLDPASAIAHHQLANTYQAARQYDKALAEYQRAIHLSPTYGLNYHALMWMQRRQGKYAEALESLRTANRLYDGDGADRALSAKLAVAYAKGGRTAMIRKEIELSSEGTRPALYLARDYAELGDQAMAMHWLRRAFASHDIEVLYINADPEFDGMRSDPDFQALEKAIGFH